MPIKTWADHPSRRGKKPAASLRRRPERRYDADRPDDPPAWVFDGPPRCCNKRLVAADSLVHYGGLSGPVRQRIYKRFPQLADVPPGLLYLCDGCRETLRREGILTKDEMPNRKRNPQATGG